MMASRPPRGVLRWLALALALAAGLWAYWTGPHTRASGPAGAVLPRAPDGASHHLPALGSGPPAPDQALGAPGRGLPVPAHGSPALPQGLPATGLSRQAAPAVPAEPVGRPNPFVALVVPSSPAHAPALPLPPGFGLAGGPESGAGDMSLSGIVWTRPQVAIIVVGGRSYVAGVGARVGEAVVEAIQEGRVILRTDQTTFELHLGGEHTP